MSEHGQPGPEGGENEGGEQTAREILRGYESIIGFDEREAEGRVGFYNTLVDGEEGLQRPIAETGLSSEVVEAVKDQRAAWEAFLEATQRNTAIIRKAIELQST